MDTKSVEALAQEVQNGVKAHSVGEEGARLRLLSATEALHRAVEGPADYMIRLRFQIADKPLQNLCMLMALDMGAADAIVSRNGATVSTSELAAELKYDELLITRVMRMLTAIGIFEESGPQRYRSNENARAMCAPGARGGFQILNGMGFRIGSDMLPYMRKTGVYQFSEPGQPTPFENTYGTDMWELFAKDAQKKRWFDDYMTGKRSGLKIPWHEVYPAASELFKDPHEPIDVAVVDVGGGQGRHVKSFRKAHPELPGRFVLQDLPETIEAFDKSSADGVEAMPHNFFDEQPLKGAKAYYMQTVLHDWSDDASRRILGNLAKAMKPNSRILIEELVMPDTGVSVVNAGVDIAMLVLPGGIERTESQWRRLCASVEPRLEVKKIWNKQKERESVLEVVLAQ